VRTPGAVRERNYCCLSKGYGCNSCCGRRPKKNPCYPDEGTRGKRSAGKNTTTAKRLSWNKKEPKAEQEVQGYGKYIVESIKNIYL
jgi:hypothetical protein